MGLFYAFELGKTVALIRERPALKQRRGSLSGGRTITCCVRSDGSRCVRLIRITPAVRRCDTHSKVAAHFQPAGMRTAHIRQDAHGVASHRLIQRSIVHRVVHDDLEAIDSLQFRAQRHRRRDIMDVDSQHHPLCNRCVERWVRYRIRPQ